MIAVGEREEEEDPPKVHPMIEREPVEDREIKEAVCPLNGIRERVERERDPLDNVNNGEVEEEQSLVLDCEVPL
jgi:methyl coenzyme M reductase gamma subunit